MSSAARIFISKSNIVNDSITVSGSDAHHLINVLRLKTGSFLEVCDMQKSEYRGIITQINGNGESVVISLSDKKTSASEFPFSVILYQGVPKGDKLETIVQKAVELGATAVVPVLCERCVSRPDEKAFAKKIERLNKIAQSAASQCGRGIIPVVLPPLPYKKACEAMAKDDLPFICYEGERTVHIKSFLEDKEPNSVSFLIGPEGGLSSGEIEYAKENGISMIGLGERILRTETASGFVLAAISVILE